jgi:hypothetical protein
MDPNSQNQLWSRWTATVVPSTRTTPSFALVRENCARFYRKAFGSATELQLVGSDVPGATWTIDCRTEGHPAHDPTYVAYMTENLRRFLCVGFGQQSKVTFDVKIEAGDKQDGTPADQIIIGPEPVVLDNRLVGRRSETPRDQGIGGAKVILTNKLQEK